MINYLVLVIVDLFYALQFLCAKAFQNRNANTLISSLNFSFGSSITICVYALIVSRFQVAVTGFSLCIAWVIAIITISLNFFSILSLAHVNLSVYSVVIMMGGMLIPSIYGIVFLKESITIGKVIGTLLVITAMLCGIEKGSAKKGAWKYYMAVFIINGLFATSQKIHQTYSSINVSASNLLFLSYAIATIITAVCILAFRGINGFGHMKSGKNLLSMSGYGVTNCTAELLSMAVMTYFPASIQFAIVSGGVILFSALFSVLKHEQQNERAILSIILAISALIVVGL